MNRAFLSKGLAGMANVTTIIAFGTAILGLLFPHKTADYVASFLEEVTAARGSLERIETSSAQTAQATDALAAALADRPRFEARSNLVQMGGLGSDDRRHEFQMTLENLTNEPITDLIILITTEENGAATTFRTHVIPPFETHREIAAGTATLVCYAYAIGDTYVSESRALQISDAPFRDQMGNAATYVFNHSDFILREEPNGDDFLCGGQQMSRSGLQERGRQLGVITD